MSCDGSGKQWTKKPPTVPGFYWVKHWKDATPEWRRPQLVDLRGEYDLRKASLRFEGSWFYGPVAVEEAPR